MSRAIDLGVYALIDGHNALRERLEMIQDDPDLIGYAVGDALQLLALAGG